MKKLAVLVLVLALCGVAGAYADANQFGAITAPEIGAIVCDGLLGDWSDESATSPDFLLWNGPVGSPTDLATTTAKFAWSDAEDLIYAAVVTNYDTSTTGGYAVIGATLTGSPNGASSATMGSPVDTAQLGFDAQTGNIYNELDFPYGDNDGSPTTNGVRYGSNTVTYPGPVKITTHEIAIPFYTNWDDLDHDGVQDGTTDTLSAGMHVYLYAVMQHMIQGSEGTNMTYDGNPEFYAGNWNSACDITLVPEPATMLLLGLGGLLLRKRR